VRVLQRVFLLRCAGGFEVGRIRCATGCITPLRPKYLLGGCNHVGPEHRVGRSRLDIQGDCKVMHITEGLQAWVDVCPVPSSSLFPQALGLCLSSRHKKRTWTGILDAAGCTSNIKGRCPAIFDPSCARLDELKRQRLLPGMH
jgi:hypothetical protein